MIPSRLFRSRRSALIWAAGILWTAYDVASAQPKDAAAGTARAAPRPAVGTDATGEPVTAADLAALANALQ